MEKIEFIQDMIGKLTKEEEKEKQKQEESEKQIARLKKLAESKDNFYVKLCEYGNYICEKKEISQANSEEIKILPEIAEIIINARISELDY